MKSFIFEATAGRVVFGLNAVEQLPREVEQLGVRRALVLSTPQQAKLASDISRWLGDQSAGI
jgi:alcohol dehydrogenase class IV